MRWWGSAALVLAAVAVLAPAAPAASRAGCSDARAASDTYAAGMTKARTAYFAKHKSATARKSFVAAQKAKLAQLRAAQKAACDATPAYAEPLPAPAPTASEHFLFSDSMSQAERDEAQGYVTFAVQDEQALLGVQFGDLDVFVSTDAAWLAQHRCDYSHYVGDCVSSTEQRILADQYCCEAAPGAVFLDWNTYDLAQPVTNADAVWVKQKIVAAQVFHVFQYQLAQDTDGHDWGGPFWLSWGSEEMMGYRVTGDRHLHPYADMVGVFKDHVKGTAVSPADVFTADLFNEGSVDHYWLAAVADRLVTVAPGGVHSLGAYWSALGGGTPWADAFTTAFGMSADAFYADFAAWRKGL